MMNKYIKRAGMAVLACQLLFTACSGNKAAETTPSADQAQTGENASYSEAESTGDSLTAGDETTAPDTESDTEPATDAAASEEETDSPDINITLPEYRLAPVTSYEADGKYIYVYCLEMDEPDLSFDKLRVYVGQKEYKDYVIYDGSVCEYAAFDNVHPDMDQKTILISSDNKLNAEDISFKADYTDSAAKQTGHKRSLPVNAEITDITTTQSYLHDSTLFCVDGIYMLRDQAETSTYGTENPHTIEARTYRFVVFAGKNKAEEAIRSFTDCLCLLSGNPNTYCEVYEYQDVEMAYINFEEKDNISFTYQVNIGIETTEELTQEEISEIDRSNFMYVGSGDDGMIFYTLE